MSTPDNLKRIIAFAAGKGGVGKTSLARDTSARLASLGHRVALVDLDPQGHAALTLGLKKAPGVYRVLVEDRPAASELVEVPPESWFNGPRQGALYVLPGDRQTSVAGAQLLVNNVDVFVLRNKLLTLLSDGVVDFVILDTAPSIQPVSPWVYTSASFAVIPMDGGLESVDGVIQTGSGFAIVEHISRGEQKLEVLGIVPNRVNPDTVLHRQNIASLQDLVWPAIRARITWQEAAHVGKALSVYAPRSPADIEANRVFKIFCGALKRQGVAI